MFHIRVIYKDFTHLLVYFLGTSDCLKESRDDLLSSLVYLRTRTLLVSVIRVQWVEMSVRRPRKRLRDKYFSFGSTFNLLLR